MPTRDLSSLFDATTNYPGVPSRAFPEGKTYRVPSPDAVTGAKLTAQAALGFKAANGAELTDEQVAKLDMDDEQERSFYMEVLGCHRSCRELDASGKESAPCGSVYDEMLADGVAWTLVATIARDAYFVITDNQRFADVVLEAMGEAEARPNRADRRAATKSTPRRRPASKPKAGTSSSRASGAKNTPATPAAASTPAPATSAEKKAPAKKAV